ncbi:bacteriocin immunity protein [Lactovum miscens]|uniref:Bacteriocin immunity protein n=1 Tax=Lactovum miscens TaxID=190387 RepID=A0A841C6A6_9LACT|nr:bacteriocin immunity protein [Lactovum miscens]MBB5887278.1 hypothetical protein [Lactovum miscens]
MKKLEIINLLYNLVLDRNIRDWERSQLMCALRNIEAGKPVKAEITDVEIHFRPLAIRSNLTPKAAEFYEKITSDSLFSPGLGGVLESFTGKK